ncbi:MAG: MATE family efflux transporter [Lachnospiraceae bacterium]|nr:MATE family efflux transporter [Lachnospiraceae bacterium]
MKKEQDFTNGKIMGPLLRFALPVFFALCLQTMYGAVDLLIVGQYAQTFDVSAVSTGTFVMHLLTSAVTGLAMGTTVQIGQKIGEKRTHEVGGIIGSSTVLFLAFGLVLTVLMQFLAPFISKLMQAPNEAFDATVSYIRICSAGAIFIVAYNVIGSIFRGMGNSAIPLLTVAIACVVNIVGDYVLVAVFDMAAAGAAIATVAAQAVSVVLSLIIVRKKKLVRIRKEDWKPKKALIMRTIHIGLPIAFQDVLVTMSFMVIAGIVNGLGVVASAGVGIAEKICGFIMLVPSAFSQSISAFVAQNIGAGKRERANLALKYAILTSLAVGVVIGYFSFFHGDMLTAIFAGDKQDVIQAGAEYLKAYAIDCLFVSFLFCFTGYFNGCGNTRFVMVQGIIGAFAVRIPISFLMSRLFPESLFLIGLATPSSTVVQIICCAVFMRRCLKKQKLFE